MLFLKAHYSCPCEKVSWHFVLNLCIYTLIFVSLKVKDFCKLFADKTKMDSVNFKKCCSSFLEGITDDDIQKFGQLKTDEERIKTIFGVPHANSYNILTKQNSKSDHLAKDFKERGNNAFQKNMFTAAVELYSKGIILQPQNTSDERENLSVMFANRSAALYRLNKYDHCLEDIHSAFDQNYPSKLQFKICDRQARCFLAQNNLTSAKKAFRQTIQALDHSNLAEEKKLKWQRDVQIMLAMLDRNKDVSNNACKNTKPVDKIFSGTTNKQYPCASSLVLIKEQPEVGRYAEARDTIKPGDFLLKEKPHCAVLLDKYSETHCFQCFIRVQTPYPCPSCSNVVFCGKQCQMLSLQTHHQTECTILSALWESGASITCMMALRIITQRDLNFFLKIKPSLEGPPKEKYSLYKSDDYLRVYDLVNHSSTRTTEDFLHRTMMAVFLLRCLKLTEYFQQNLRENSMSFSENAITENEQYIGGLILRHLQALQFNSHEVAELVITGGHKESIFIGGAVYPTLALFNHSCNPGIVRYHIGTEVVVRAIRSIKKGEMIAENYGPIFTQVERKERQYTLKSQYWFDCKCEACLGDWPTLENMNNNVMRFHCDCGNTVVVPVDTNEFMIPCSNCNQHINIFKGLKVLQDTDVMFRVAKSLSEERKFDAALTKFLNLLVLLDTTLAPPFRDYHQCQQEIRTCMLSCGNLFVKET